MYQLKPAVSFLIWFSLLLKHCIVPIDPVYTWHLHASWEPRSQMTAVSRRVNACKTHWGCVEIRLLRPHSEVVWTTYCHMCVQCVRKCVRGHTEGPSTQLTSSAWVESIISKCKTTRSLSNRQNGFSCIGPVTPVLSDSIQIQVRARNEEWGNDVPILQYFIYIIQQDKWS